MQAVELVFLGTASAAPTKDRNLSSIAIRADGEWLLFDCPEGCQQQMLKADVSYMRIHHIFFTHLHLDHTLGLPGLLATFQMHQRIDPLYLYVPMGWKNKMISLVRLAPKTSFDVQINEMKKGTVLKQPDFNVSCVPLKHEITCMGLVFKQADKPGEFQRQKAQALQIPEGPLWRQLQLGRKITLNKKTIKPEQVMDYSNPKKGIKIAYVVDTAPTNKYLGAIKDSDVLVHEATFSMKNQKRAQETLHSTAMDAAHAAVKTNCKQLFLTHFSSRHKDPQELENEARTVFANVQAATDLYKLTLKTEK